VDRARVSGVKAKVLVAYCAASLAIAACSLHSGPPMATSDPRPSPEGVSQPSFLGSGCRLERTAGADWNRLWLNCGKGPHLLTEPSSLTWHVQIRNPEQALELVRLFTSHDGCERFPQARWIEVQPGERDGWLRLDAKTFVDVCPKASARDVTDAGAHTKRFLVESCLIEPLGGDLYRVVHSVKENGETSTQTETLVLAKAGRRIGNCDMDLHARQEWECGEATEQGDEADEP
jgi:hypothetical protein